MKKEPLFVALSNQKGGVGKSTLTVLLASYFHYHKAKNVLVVDCDYPQHSMMTLREWGYGQKGLQYPGFHARTSQGNCLWFYRPFRYRI